MSPVRALAVVNSSIIAAVICLYYQSCLMAPDSTNCPSFIGRIVNAQHKADESMSAEEMFRYLHWTNSTSCLFAVDFGFSVVNAQGIAAPDGHKSVCLDKSIAPAYNKCLVYSFGINNQWAFEEAMERFGCRVYSFDPSMGVKDHNRTEKIHFFNIGLSGVDGLHPTKGWNMKTASSIYQMLATSHGSSTPIDVLKMDVEYSEWDAIPQMLRSGFKSWKEPEDLSVSVRDPIHGSCNQFPSWVETNENILEWNWPGTIPDITDEFSFEMD